MTMQTAYRPGGCVVSREMGDRNMASVVLGDSSLQMLHLAQTSAAVGQNVCSEHQQFLFISTQLEAFSGKKKNIYIFMKVMKVH